MKVTIAFRHKPTTFLTKAISWWTAPFIWKFNGQWRDVANHVEIIFGMVRYSTGALSDVWSKSSKPLDGEWRMYHVVVSVDEYKKMLQQAEEFLGTPYDWANIFLSDILKRNQGAGDRLTCDEGVGRCLKWSKKFNGLHELNNLNPHKLEIFITELVCR